MKIHTLSHEEFKKIDSGFGFQSLEIIDGELKDTGLDDLDIKLTFKRRDGKPENAKIQRLVERGVFDEFDLTETLDGWGYDEELAIDVFGANISLRVTTRINIEQELGNIVMQIADISEVSVHAEFGGLKLEDDWLPDETGEHGVPNFTVNLNVLFRDSLNIENKKQQVVEHTEKVIRSVMLSTFDFDKFSELSFSVEGWFPQYNDESGLHMIVDGAPVKITGENFYNHNFDVFNRGWDEVRKSWDEEEGWLD